MDNNRFAVVYEYSDGGIGTVAKFTTEQAAKDKAARCAGDRSGGDSCVYHVVEIKHTVRQKPVVVEWVK